MSNTSALLASSWATGPWANAGRTQMGTTSMYERMVWWLYLCFLNSPVTLYMQGVLRLIPIVLRLHVWWFMWLLNLLGRADLPLGRNCLCHLIHSLWSTWAVFGIDVVTFRSFRHWCDIHTLNTAISWIARFHDVQNCIVILLGPNLDWSLHQILFQTCK